MDRIIRGEGERAGAREQGILVFSCMMGRREKKKADHRREPGSSIKQGTMIGEGKEEIDNEGNAELDWGNMHI